MHIELVIKKGNLQGISPFVCGSNLDIDENEQRNYWN